MNRTTPYGTRFTGIFRDDVTPATKIYNNGTLVATLSGNDIVVADNVGPASPATITGDTSAYVEGTITGIIGALEGVGIVVDGTTT